MSSSSPLRIRIEDLPAIENLSEEEMEEIYGAGRARRRGFTGDAPQMLEVRQMLSATLNIGIDYGTLRVAGTNQSDNLFIRQENNTVTIENFAANGGMERIQISDAIQRIDISTGAGDDFIHLAGVNAQGGVTLDGGDGADLVVNSRTDAGLTTQVATLATSVKSEDAVLAQGSSPQLVMGTSVETRMDSEGNTFRLSYLNGQLREAEIRNTTGGVSRIRWAEDETVVRDTYQDGKQTLQEVWTTNGGYLRTEWREDESLIRESFVNNQQQTREEWQGDSFVRTAWKENGDQLRQTFSGERVTREELWNSSGGYIRTDFTAEGGFSRKTYLDDQLRQTETANGTKSSRTVWQDNGTKLQQDFVNGSLVLEREWKANGQFHKTTFSANGNRKRDTFVDGQLRVREQWVKNTFTRTSYDLEKGGTSERYVDNLLVQEQRWDAQGNRVTVTYAPETGEKVREEVVGGTFKKVTVWNAARTTTVIYQKKVEISREIWQGDNYTRTITDGKGNTVQSVYVAGKLDSVNQWEANGRRQRIAYDTATGKQSQWQIWGTAGEYEITKWNEGISTRRVYQDQQEVLREVRDGKTFVQTRWDVQGNVVKDTFVKDRLSTREFTDASGNRLRYTYAPATGERTKLEKWDSSGGYDVTSWSVNGSKREVYQGKKLALSEVVKGNTLTRTLYDAKGNWRQDVYTDGKLTLRIEQDNAGNSIRRTYSTETGTLTREDVRNSTGGTRITTWSEEGQLQQTYQDGKLILREQWSGDSFVRTAWDGNGGTLREVFSAGRLTLREVTVAGTTQRTTYFEAPAATVTGNWKGSTTKSAVPAVYIQETTEVLNSQGGRQVTHVYSDGTQARHHYQGSEEQLRQTWDAAGVQTKESWGTGNVTVEKAVISALNAVLKGFQKSKQGYALVGLQSGFPKSVVKVSQPGKIDVNAKNVAVAKGVQLRGTDKLEAAVQKAQESFVNPRKFGRTFNALTKGISVDTQIQDLQSLEQATLLLQTALESLDGSQLPQLLEELQKLEKTASSETRQAIADLRQGATEILNTMATMSAQSEAWAKEETRQLTQVELEAAVQRSALDKVIKEYNGALAEILKEQDENRILRIQEASNTTTQASSQFGGRGGKGAYNPDAKQSPEYIDPDAPQNNAPGRIMMVYDKVLVVTNQLRYALSSILKGSNQELAAEIEAIIQSLDAGKSAYVTQTESAATIQEQELARISKTSSEQTTQAITQAANNIANEKKNAETKAAPHLSIQSSLQQMQQTQMDAAIKERDRVVVPNEQAITRAKNSANRELIDAKAERDRIANGEEAEGFGLYSYNDFKEDAKEKGGAASDWVKEKGGTASDWWKEQQQKATNWYNNREREILQARDKVVNSANEKIAAAKATFNAAVNQIKEIFKAPLEYAQKQIDTVLAERDKAVKKINEEKDKAVAKWETWEQQQRQTLSTTYKRQSAKPVIKYSPMGLINFNKPCPRFLISEILLRHN
ncbi:MAG: hypothetical protein R3C12_15125 [Planctomycetaceae bacterium]